MSGSRSMTPMGPTDRRSDRAVRQVIALALLVFVAGVALRGRVPGAPRAQRSDAVDNPASTVVVVGLLVTAVAVVVLAVVVRARQRPAVRVAANDRADWLRGDSGRLTWRAALIGFAVIALWLTLALLLSRVGGGDQEGPPPSPPAATDQRQATQEPSDRQAEPPAPKPKPSQDDDLFAYFAVATAVFLGAIVVGTFLSSRRRPVAESADDEPRQRRSETDDGETDTLARAAEVALSAVEDLSRDPRRAIIACYAAMERELARVPDAAPQDFDTASEVLARAVDQRALAPGPATQLVDLFDEARFSPHVMNEGHRELAVRALQAVLADLPAAGVPT